MPIKTEPVEPAALPSGDRLVPDLEVAKEIGCTTMSMWRWDRDPVMIANGWPPLIRIIRRKFRSRAALDAFKAKMLEQGLKERATITRNQKPERVA
jgi:hypothetical protein